MRSTAASIPGSRAGPGRDGGEGRSRCPDRGHAIEHMCEYAPISPGQPPIQTGRQQRGGQLDEDAPADRGQRLLGRRPGPGPSRAGRARRGRPRARSQGTARRTGITKNPTTPSTPPRARVRIGTPASRSRRPGSRYFATLPSTTISTASPSTVQPSGSLRGTAHTAIPASTSSSPGSTGTSTPTMPTTTSTPAISVSRPSRRCSHVRLRVGAGAVPERTVLSCAAPAGRRPGADRPFRAAGPAGRPAGWAGSTSARAAGDPGGDQGHPGRADRRSRVPPAVPARGGRGVGGGRDVHRPGARRRPGRRAPVAGHRVRRPARRCRRRCAATAR